MALFTSMVCRWWCSSLKVPFAKKQPFSMPLTNSPFVTEGTFPSCLKYNAFCVISDGVNNKAGSFFAPYEFFYGWRRVAGLAKDLPAPKPFEGEFCVYVLKCSDNSFYVGQTNDLARRIEEHKKGTGSWTSKHLPIELIHWEYYQTREEAVDREQKLKTGFGRKWLKENFAKGKLKQMARQAGVDGIDSMFTLVQGMLNQN